MSEKVIAVFLTNRQDRDSLEWSVTIQLTLSEGVSIRRDFSMIENAVRALAGSCVSTWQKTDAEISIVVRATRPGSEDDHHMIGNAVCAGVLRKFIPRSEVRWLIS